MGEDGEDVISAMGSNNKKDKPVGELETSGERWSLDNVFQRGGKAGAAPERTLKDEMKTRSIPAGNSRNVKTAR